jgi:hypothetical protein
MVEGATYSDGPAMRLTHVLGTRDAKEYTEIREKSSRRPWS